MFLKISECPHCGSALDTDIYESLDDPLGEPDLLFCPSPFCNVPISNGKSEWGDKTSFQKCIYVLRCVVKVLWCSAVIFFFSLIAIDAALSEIAPQISSPAYIFLFALLVITIMSIMVYRTTRIKIDKSNKRYNLKLAKDDVKQF